jgi:alkylhydroperoxidase/carboxymuconolactone decarboxylase family protein YurZ
MSELMDAGAQQALKERVIAARGYWHPFHEGLLQLDPRFLAAYLDFVAAPWRTGALEPKVREFIYIAADASCAHLYERGMRRHIEFALEKGATSQEIIEVLQLTTALGCQTISLGAQILAEECGVAGTETSRPAELSPEQAALRQDFLARMGYWPDYADALVRLDPGYMPAFLELIADPWTTGALPPKVKEFINLALVAAPTTLNGQAVRHHIRRALHHGATQTELMEVLQLASAIAIHSCTIGVPALMASLQPGATPEV